MAENYDVAVIGAGPGGYVAAIRCAQLGLKTAIIEETHLGGICLNWGCIPTKALLRSSEIYHTMTHASDYGLKVKEASVDIQAIVKRSRDVSAQLSGGIKHLMKKNKIKVFDGRGVVKKSDGSGVILTVSQKDGKAQDVSAKKVILATGARARTLPHLEADGKLVWTYKEAMVPEELPKTLLVVGSGAIGVEFASFYNALGVDVTVVEIADRILPVEDSEISAMAQKSFEKQGLKIRTKTTVEKLTKGKNTVKAVLKSGKNEETVEFERAIVAIGIIGNTENFGLEKTKIKVEKNQILVDEYCKTDDHNIYAIGDVAGAPWLAHKASHEGVMVAEVIAGGKNVHPMKKEQIPGCTYSHPQVASIGMTEDKAKEAKRKVKVGRFPFMGNGKAIALGEPEGLIKTIFDAQTGEILGAHMIGAEVTELIQGFAIAIAGELTEAEMMNTVFPHPTLSEMMHESVLDAYGRALHF